jgi:hypothetical protein
MKLIQQLILLVVAMGGCWAQDACTVTEGDSNLFQSEITAACTAGAKTCTADAATFASTQALKESCK